MKKTIAAALIALSPLAAWASCTWTSTGTFTAKLVCTSANESIPSASDAGLSLLNCKKGVAVFIEADSGQTLSGSGTLKVAVYNEQAKAWGEVPDLAISPTVASARYQGFAAIWVADSSGRIAVYPVSLGVSSGGLTAYLACN